MEKYAAEIASNLRQIEELNASIRAMNHTMATKPECANLFPHLQTQIEVATMRIANLNWWVRHWVGA